MNLRITAQLLVVCLLLAVVFAQVAGAAGANQSDAHIGSDPFWVSVRCRKRTTKTRG